MAEPLRPRRVLVVKLCCIGDVIFLTPALRALRQELPEAEIVYLGSSWVKDVLANVPFIDRTILFDAPYREGKLRKIRETLRLIAQLRRERFDCMIVAHRNPTFAKLGWLAGIGRRVGFSYQPTRFVTDPVPFDTAQSEVRRFLALVRALDIPTPDESTELVARPEQIASVAAKLREADLPDDRPAIGIFPGGGENPGTKMTIKRWDAANYSRLCETLAREYGATIALLGGPADREVNGEVAAGIDASVSVIDLASRFTIRELPALMKRFQLVIGNDTGPLHVAAAVGTPTVYLFGPTDPRLLAPHNKNVATVWKQVPCSPCHNPDSVMDKRNFQGQFFGCRTGTHECFKTMKVEDVMRAVRGLVKETGSSI